MSVKKIRHFKGTDDYVIIAGRKFVFLSGSDHSIAISKDGYVFTSKRRGGDFRGSLMANGYRVAGGTSFCGLVHRMVYEVFTGKRIPDGMEIDHVNTVRDDNRLANLKVVTRSGNRRNPISYPRVVDAMRSTQRIAAEFHKKRVYGVRLSDGTATRVFPSISEAAAETGASPTHLGQVLKGVRRSSGGHLWYFAEDAK